MGNNPDGMNHKAPRRIAKPRINADNDTQARVLLVIAAKNVTVNMRLASRYSGATGVAFRTLNESQRWR